MADSTTQTYTNISDLPDYAKPYYKMLLNGVSGITFDPNYIAQQIGSNYGTASTTQPTVIDAGGSPVPQQSPYIPPQVSSAPTTAAPVNTTLQSQPTQAADDNTLTFGGGRMTPSQLIQQNVDNLLNSSVFGSGRTLHRASGGPTPLVSSQLGGNVYNQGIGAIVNPGQVQSTPILTGQGGGVYYIGPNGVVLPGTPGYNAGTPPAYNANSGGSRFDPGNGATPQGNPGMPSQGGGVPSQYMPGQGGSGSPSSSVLYASGAAPDINAASGGYNPAQYASGTVAAQLAQALGGSVEHTAGLGGPNAPPSQNMLNLGGPDDYNAGLVQQLINAYGPDQAKAMLKAEGAHLAGGGLASIKPKHYDAGGPTWGGGTDPGAGSTPSSYFQLASPSGTQPQTSSTGSGVFQPYQPYGGQRILSSDPNADPNSTYKLSDRTFAAESGLSSLPQTIDSTGKPIGQLGYASDLMGYAGDMEGSVAGRLGQLANSYDPANTTIKSQYQQMGYNPTTFSANTINPNSLQLGSAGTVQMDPLSMYQAEAPGQVTRDTVSTPMFDQSQAQKYMDPYTQNVTDVQKQAAVRDFNEAKAGRDAAAVHAGAFGGSRQAVADSLANRDLQTQLAQIQATGNENAYQNAQQQFAADRAADMGAQQFNVGSGLQAALANQGTDQATKLANLQAALGTQGLNTNAQLQAALANQSTAANQYGTLFSGQLQSQLANQNAGLAAQQLGEQSKQFGANLQNNSAQFADTQQLAARELNERLAQAALGQQLQAYGQVGQTGVNQADLSRLATQMDIQNLQSQLQMGQNEDARRQAGLDIGYQDYLNAKNYPFQMANFYSGILRGVPVQFNQDAVQVGQANYNPLAQGIGNAAGIAGTLGQLFKNGGNG